MTYEAMIEQIRARVRVTSLTEVARDLKVSIPHLHDVLAGKRKAGPAVAAGMGLVAVTTYRKVQG